MITADMSWIDIFIEVPQGPGTPFGTPLLILLDTFRVFVMVVGLGLAAVTPYAAFTRSMNRGQLIWLASLALYAGAASGTELAHLGDYAHWTLVLNVSAGLLGALGMWSLFSSRPS